MLPVSFSVGNNVKNVRGLKQFTLPFDKFADAVLRKSGKAKDGIYVCGPMADGYRQTANAKPIAYLALDFDHLTEVQWKKVAAKSKQWASFVYTTPSHNPAANDHRLRVFIHLSREVNRDEYRTLYALAAAQLGVPGDMSGAKPEQAMYTRRDDTIASKNPTAQPLNVDELLGSNPQEADPLGAKPAWLVSKSIAQIGAAPVEHKPYWATDAANHCAQLRHMRDTKGDGGIEQWRGMIGVIKFSQDGIELAKEWTANRIATGHGQANVERDWETWRGTGPTRCETFERANPSGCEGCPSKGKIGSPAQLGHRIAAPAVETVEIEVDGTQMKLQMPEKPYGYEWDGSHMVRWLKDKDDVMVAHKFSPTHFYVLSRVQMIATNTGNHALMIRRHLPKKKPRDFFIESSTLASQVELGKALANNEVLMTHNADAAKHVTAYLKDSLTKLVNQAEELEQTGAFGWNAEMDTFLLGDRLYTADGGMTTALVGGAAASYKSSFDKITGTAAGWSEGVDLLYNREGMQHMQYALCSAFGSLLSPFAESLYKGIPCAITGEDSGKGKSAVCKAALYAFGDAERMTINGDRGTTLNNLYMQMGAYNNMPLLMDEVTNIEPKKLSDLLYTMSGGRDKGRLMAGGRTGGVKAQEVGEWRSSLYLTANTKLSNALASKQGNTEAEAVRLFEISIDTYGVQMADLDVADIALSKIQRNSGGAGEQYIKYLVANRTAVETAFLVMAKKVGSDAGLARVSQYRFFRQHVICTLTAANILESLGLVKFDMQALYGWAVTHLHKLCQDVQQNNVTTTSDALGQMLTALSPNIIQTKEYRDLRTNKFGPEDVHQPHGPVVGRVVLDTGRLYLSQVAAKKWCGDNRQNLQRIIDQATNDLVYLDDHKQFLLTKGTTLSAGRIPVYEFNWKLLDTSGDAA